MRMMTSLKNDYNHTAFKQWENVEFQELIKVPSKFDAKAKRDTGFACNSSCRQSRTASAPLNVHSGCDLLGDQVHGIASDLQRHGFRAWFYSQLKMRRMVKNSPLFDMTVSPHAGERPSGQTGHVNLQVRDSSAYQESFRLQWGWQDVCSWPSLAGHLLRCLTK